VQRFLKLLLLLVALTTSVFAAGPNDAGIAYNPAHWHQIQSAQARFSELIGRRLVPDSDHPGLITSFTIRLAAGQR
jgi:hypothetical protein